MKNKNKIPKFNINAFKTKSNMIYLTPRNTENCETLFLETNDYLLTNYDKLKSRIHSPLQSSQNNSNNILLNKTYNTIKKTHSPEYFSNDNFLLFSCKNLEDDNYISQKRLKTFSSSFSRLGLNNENINKLMKIKNKSKKRKLNVNNSLLKTNKNKVNEVNFLPSPLLINTKLFSKKLFLNHLQNNKNIKIKKHNKTININTTENKKKDKILPIFLREKYNIKGTNIISPFCIKARDEFLYKRIFYTYFEKPPDTKKIGVNNKLNIIYAESEEKFKKKIYNLNRKFRKQGKKEKNAICPNSVENKLNGIKNKIRFMKKIVDYAYPETILTRLREENKNTKNSRNLYRNLPPFKTADFYQENENKTKTENLTNSLTITKA